MNPAFRRWTLAVSASAVVALFAFGCTSSTGTTCTQTDRTAATGRAEPAINQCVAAGGQCISANAGMSQCPAGMHLAPTGTVAQTACGGSSYGNDPTSDPCSRVYANTGAPGEEPNRAGVAAALIPCCLPGSGDGGTDGARDARDEADAPASVGSCHGQTCAAGCSCGIFPTTGAPTCFCSDAGSPDAGRDAAAPNCGSIYCFSGCVCADVGQSACTCN
jgi:hypothetical protein